MIILSIFLEQLTRVATQDDDFEDDDYNYGDEDDYEQPELGFLHDMSPLLKEQKHAGNLLIVKIISS